MKNRKWSWVFAAVLAGLVLAGCGGGGGGGGSADGDTDNDDTASTSNVSTAYYDVTLPEGVTTGNVDGDVDGKMVYAGEDDAATSVVMGGSPVPRGFTGTVTGADMTSRDVAGFVAERPAPNDADGSPAVSASQTVDLAVDAVEAELGAISDLTGIMADGFQTISRQTVANGVIELATFRLTTSTNVKPTDVASDLVELWGLSSENGSVNSLPDSPGDEAIDTEFTVRAGVLYDSSDRIFIAVVVVPTVLAGSYQGLTDLLADPNNAVERGTTLVDETDTFTGTGGGGLADFLFVVDNSGSMSQEQTNLENAASAFSSVLSGSGLNFRLGVITTDSSDLVTEGFTGFTDNTDEFETVVNGLGTSGSGTESGIYHAEEALSTGGSVPAANFPRQDAQMSVVMISDEPDQYTCYSGTSLFSCDGPKFNKASNVFLDNYIVHAIVNTDPQSTDDFGSSIYGEDYIDLANSTGGSRAPISDPSGEDLTPTDFEQVMTAIAQKAGGAASQFGLDKTPVPSTISVTNEGTAVARDSADGWTYNSSANAVVFNGNEVPDSGDAIEVSYKYAEGGSSGSGDGSSGGDDTGSGADFAGTWSGDVTASSSVAECEGSDSGTITITDLGSGQYEVNEISGRTFTGTVNGDTLSSDSSFSYYEDAGTVDTTINSWSVTLDSSGDAFSGAASFSSSYVDGSGSCSGTTAISATRQGGTEDGGGSSEYGTVSIDGDANSVSSALLDGQDLLDLEFDTGLYGLLYTVVYTPDGAPLTDGTYQFSTVDGFYDGEVAASINTPDGQFYSAILEAGTLTVSGDTYTISATMDMEYYEGNPVDSGTVTHAFEATITNPGSY